MKVKANGTSEHNGHTKTESKEAYFWFALVTVFTVAVCHPVVFEYCRMKSLEYIIMFRTRYGNIYIDTTMNLMTNLADKYGIAIFFVVANVLLSPTKAQVLLASACLSISLNILCKMTIRDPRPYFYSNDYAPAG